MRPDIYSTNFGSIIRIEPVTVRARRWFDRHVESAPDGTPCDCDHRYGVELLIAARQAGLRLQDTASGRYA